MHQTEFTQLQGAFAQSGWMPGQFPCIGTKEFETACTPKRAVLYQYPNGALMGSYESEGRNVLSTHCWHVDASAAVALRDQAERIDHELSHTVDQSYARRLWLLGIRPHASHRLSATPA
jgi:hypothetical protein